VVQVDVAQEAIAVAAASVVIVVAAAAAIEILVADIANPAGNDPSEARAVCPSRESHCGIVAIASMKQLIATFKRAN
jgi:hypothetical protein